MLINLEVLPWAFVPHRITTVRSATFTSHVQLLIPPIQADPWQGPVSSLCQLFLILSANVFLAARLVTFNSPFYP